MHVHDLMTFMNELAPLRLAESWDNVGLLIGDPSDSVHKILTCLTLTPEVADEAVTEGANLIIAHHPILFRPTKTIRADHPATNVAWKLARHGIAVISHHTAWDGAKDGANHFICNALGLRNIRPMSPATGPDCVKFVVFVPESEVEAVRQAAFSAGAGQIGNYAECSFISKGLGTFHAGEGTKPTIGQPGQRETTEEARLEIISHKSMQNRVLSAIRQAHPYEEPAIDIYPLAGVVNHANEGVGRIGNRPEPLTIKELASLAALTLFSRAVQISAPREDANRTYQTIAAACGAGDDLVDLALACGAEALVTGELRYHTILKAKEAGLATVLVGHHASERVSMEYLASIIQQKCPDLKVWASRSEHEPLVNA